jgi:hypothetical protein
MNWLKVGAIVAGGVIVFFVVDSVIHVLLGLLTAIAFVAIVGGGAYVALKIAGARRRRQVRSRPERDRQVKRDREPEPELSRTVVVPPPAARPAPVRHDVEDDLARLKREMDQ